MGLFLVTFSVHQECHIFHRILHGPLDHVPLQEQPILNKHLTRLDVAPELNKFQCQYDIQVLLWESVDDLFPALTYLQFW